MPADDHRAVNPFANLVSQAAGLLGRLFEGSADARKPSSIKLIHTSELRAWQRFPRCQDAEGVSYGDYLRENQRLRQKRRAVQTFVDGYERRQALDSDDLVEYHREFLTVPRAPFSRRASIHLTYERLPGSRIQVDSGEVRNGVLIVPAGLLQRRVRVRYLAPARVAHRTEITELTDELAGMTDEQRAAFDEVTASRYAQPVLFVSHRWETADHPDPTGDQLRRLKQLDDCFLIYDYCSFPQLPRSPEEETTFQSILASMGEVIENVIILAGPDYLRRGWCVYEYLVASMKSATVCDEVQDPSFVATRDWMATPPPIPLNPFRDSFESQQSNYINQMILESINRVLPVFRDAEFRLEHDHTMVTELLRNELKGRLPARKEHQAYLGEWKYVQWTDEDLAHAFDGEVPVPNQMTLKVQPFDTAVPSTIAAAARDRYKIRRMSSSERGDPFAGFIR